MTTDHDSFGYKGSGIYACQCGQIISTAGLLKTDGEGSTPNIKALKDQHQAHKREMTR